MRTPPHRVSPRSTAVVIAASCVLVAGPTHAETTEIGPGDNLSASIGGLMPGDELVLQGGTYTLGGKLTIALTGSQTDPIVIRSKDGEVAHITRDASQNTINFENARHVVLRGLEVSGGSHGIRLNNSSFITVESCFVHDTADVGISANYNGSTYEGLRFVGNEVAHTGGTGEGFYLGCNNNGCQMFDSIIQGNWVHHTNGGSVVQGDGIEIKEGSYNNLIADNVIHDTNYPCILTYSTVGNGDRNIIERNVMWNCGDHAIQSAADAVIVNNIILSANGDGIRAQPHQSGAPSNMHIAHNTVLMSQGAAMRLSGIAGAVTVANNALYATGTALRADGNLSSLVVAGNAGMGGTQGISGGFSDTGALGVDFLGATMSGAVPNDVFPAPASLLLGGGDANHVEPVDFNGTPRNGVADVGAYHFDAAGNPGWALSAGFKEMSAGGPGGSGGGAGQGGGAHGQGGRGEGGDGVGTGTGASGQGGHNSGANANGSEDSGGCQVAAVGAGRDGAPWLALLFGVAATSVRRRERHRCA